MIPAALIVASALTLSTPTSPTAMASVLVFAANVDRQWPTDVREPFVTAEALRLMAAAARALADDGHVNDGKLKDAIGRLDAAHDALSALAPDDARRPEAVRAALIEGSEMLRQLTAALHADDDAMKRRLAELKRSADSIDKKQEMPKQTAALERYFKQASDLLKSLLRT